MRKIENEFNKKNVLIHPKEKYKNKKFCKKYQQGNHMKGYTDLYNKTYCTGF